MNNDMARWCDAGLPRVIAEWVANFPKRGMGIRYAERANRFADYWRTSPEKADELSKAWSKIEKSAANADALLNLFITMPDRPEQQPFTAIYGRRAVDPGEERRRYDACLEHVLELQKLLRHKRYKELLTDATATSDAHSAAISFREIDVQFIEGLRRLRLLLERVNPAAKVPTDHWSSPGAAGKNYAIMVGALNRYLRAPQHSALAVIANANCPEVTVTAEQIRKAYARAADKRV